MTRGFLAVYTLLFLVFGAFAFMKPNQIVDMMAASSMGTDGIYELRSNYGGVSIGIGLMCLASVFRADLQRPALFVLLAYTGGYALGRIAALPFDGVPSATLVAYSVFEGITALLAFLLLRLNGRNAA